MKIISSSCSDLFNFDSFNQIDSFVLTCTGPVKMKIWKNYNDTSLVAKRNVVRDKNFPLLCFVVNCFSFLKVNPFTGCFNVSCYFLFFVFAIFFLNDVQVEGVPTGLHEQCCMDRGNIVLIKSCNESVLCRCNSENTWLLIKRMLCLDLINITITIHFKN